MEQFGILIDIVGMKIYNESGNKNRRVLGNVANRIKQMIQQGQTPVGCLFAGCG
jgi:hypothetical protein